MDKQWGQTFLRLATIGAFGLQLTGCAAEPGLDGDATDTVTTSALSRTSVDLSDAATVKSTSTATTETKPVTTTTTTTTTASTSSSSAAGAVKVNIPTSGVLETAQFCYASFAPSDYPRYSYKFNDAWAETTPVAINNMGQIAGTFRPAANQRRKGFIRQANGSFGPAPWYGADYNVNVTAINDLGHFVGYIDNGLDYYAGFFDSAGVLSEAYAPSAINNLGQIVGTHDYDTWGGLSSQREGFLRNANGTIYSLGDDFYPVAINSLGQIAGFTPADDGGIFDVGALYSSGIIDTDGHFTPIKYVNGKFAPQPVGMNDLGQVVGFFLDAAGHHHGFVSDAAGNSFVIDYPGNAFTNFHPTGINNLAQVVGWADNGSTPRQQFLRDASGQFNFFEPAGPNGTTIDEGRAINDLGQDTGIYNDGAITKGFATGPVFVEPFASFPVTLTDLTPSTGGMTVWGSFTPCSGRAVSPTGSPLILKVYQPGVAWASVAIPAGTFLPQTGKFEYHATHHGMTIDAYIWGPLSDGHFDFRVYATGVKGLPTAGAVTVSLAIGDNMGTATMNSPTYH